MSAYDHGLNGKQAVWAAKKYKGHCVLPSKILEELKDEGVVWMYGDVNSTESIATIVIGVSKLLDELGNEPSSENSSPHAAAIFIKIW